MGWTPLYLKMDQKKVLILGAGEVGERRARRFVKSGAEVVISGGTVSPELLDLGAKQKSLQEVEIWVNWADLVVVASGDEEINNKVSLLAGEKLLNRADFPDEGNLIVPTTFFIGEAQISIFTGGKSPLMAKMLRKKIQSTITDEDILQIELQDYAREKLKKITEKQRIRRDYLYKILNNSQIKEYLGNGNIEDAKNYVDNFIKSIEE